MSCCLAPIPTCPQNRSSITIRFQIEFNFRDAKQYWGLEDFMNVRQQTVTNAHSALSKLLSAGLIRVTMAHIYNYNCYRVAKVSNEIL